MGCSFSRDHFSDFWTHEEKAIAMAEAKLNISSVHADVFLAEFSKNRNGLGFSNQNQFLQAANTLGLYTVGVTEEKTPMHNFYQGFTTTLREYDTRKLCVLGALLGKGEIENKISILFEQFDRDASGSMDYKEFKTMLSIIIEIALVQLPNFAIELTHNLAIKRRLTKYAKRLSLTTKALVMYFRYLVASDAENNLSLPDLIKAVEDPEFKLIFSTAKLRSIGYEKYHTLVINSKLVREFFNNKKPSHPDFEFLDKVHESDSDNEDSKVIEETEES